MFSVAVMWSSSDNNAIRHVLPVLWMTSWYHTTARHSRREYGVCQSDSPAGGSIGDKVWFYSCLV